MFSHFYLVYILPFVDHAVVTFGLLLARPRQPLSSPNGNASGAQRRNAGIASTVSCLLLLGFLEKLTL